ncbi:MAG: PAS domain S-box protein [Thermodesulfobacteriota bacterium]|nr:PAS domain S-box protein [Thermodesulfobacteriota bacterium]
MAEGNTLKGVKRSIVVFSAVSILVIGVLVALVSIIPLYNQLKKDEERNLLFFLKAKTTAIEEYLSKTKEIALHTSSKSKTREKLKAYNQGKINLNEYVNFSKPILIDALNRFEDVAGISRFDQKGNLMIEVGQSISEELRHIQYIETKEVYIEGPITEGDKSYLIVSAFIVNSQSMQIGRDVFLFTLSGLQRIVEDYTGLGETGETVLGIQHYDHCQLLFPQRDSKNNTAEIVLRDSPIGTAMYNAFYNKRGVLYPNRSRNGSEVIAYSPVKGIKWGIVVKINKEEFYALVYNQIVLIGTIIIALILLGTFGMLQLLHPLTGKIFIHTDELEAEIQEKTAALHNELSEHKRTQESLQKAHNQLEQRVKKRTADLTKINLELLTEISERKRAEEALRESENSLAEAQSIAHLGNWDLDLTRNKLKWSDEVYRIFGLEPQEFDATYEAALNIIHPDDREFVNNSYRESVKNSGIFDIVYRIVRPDGELRIVHTKAKDITDETRKTIRSIGTIQDITERKQAQENLKRAATILETMIDGVVITDLSGRIIDLNRAAMDQLGYIKEELIGKNAQDILSTEEDRKKFYKDLEKLISRKKIIASEYLVKRKDGSTFPTSLSLSVTIDSDGKSSDIVAVSRDITLRKKTEEALKQFNMELEENVRAATKELSEEKEKLDVILHNTADGILVTDLQNRVILINPAAECLLGITMKKVLGKKIDLCINDKTLKEKIFTTRKEERMGYEFELEYKDPEGFNSRVLSGNTACLKSREGKVMGVVTALNDITKLRDLDRMKTDFISTAAHELRTPLTSIQGFSEILLIKDDLLEEEKKRFLTYINKQAVGLAMIISDLLDISRIESGLGFTLSGVKCNAVDSIKNIIPYFQEMSPKHSFEMVLLPEEPVKVFMDSEKIEQVLMNILSNAVKYSPEDGVIRVSGEMHKDSYQISVEDHGIGMTPDQVEKIFDKFYRAKTSDTAPEGTGLGMTITKYIIEAHGGKVWIESELGKGTTVRFTIPIT